MGECEGVSQASNDRRPPWLSFLLPSTSPPRNSCTRVQDTQQWYGDLGDSDSRFSSDLFPSRQFPSQQQTQVSATHDTSQASYRIASKEEHDYDIHNLSCKAALLALADHDSDDGGNQSPVAYPIISGFISESSPPAFVVPTSQKPSRVPLPSQPMIPSLLAKSSQLSNTTFSYFADPAMSPPEPEQQQTKPEGTITWQESIHDTSPDQIAEAPSQRFFGASFPETGVDVLESPTTRRRYKQFYRTFKQKEKESGSCVAKDFIEDYFKILPQKVHWRLYLELAELSRRDNLVKEAKSLYESVIQMQPASSQVWLDYAKLEEEVGDLLSAKALLYEGLANCQFNENLVIKAVKVEEKLGNLAAARSLLSKIKNMPLNKSWRVILEGALLESRAGEALVARAIFEFLLHHERLAGPIYQEAYKFEEKCENFHRGKEIVELGLQAVPRYGPLWFSALHCYEKLSIPIDKIRQCVIRGIQYLSKELTWKFFFEAAQVEDRAGCLSLSREAYARAALTCPATILWKVWLGGVRTELGNGEVAVARLLSKRAIVDVPGKILPNIVIDMARIEEFSGNPQKSREILAKARENVSYEWKVFLETALIELRARDFKKAFFEIKNALKVHPSAGRLWAVYMQLRPRTGGYEDLLTLFKKALCEVPKSGEVWCEGARIFIEYGDYASAEMCLSFATQFTPQYGDSFIELVHKDLLDTGGDLKKFEEISILCSNADPNYGPFWVYCKRSALDTPRQVLRNAREFLLSVGRNKIDINAMYALNINEASVFEKKKLIFGSDQIKP